MRKILLITYILLVGLFALASSTVTYFNHTIGTFIIEVIIDSIFIAGIILYLNNKHFKLWSLPFLVAVVFQFMTFHDDPRITIFDIVRRFYFNTFFINFLWIRCVSTSSVIIINYV